MDAAHALSPCARLLSDAPAGQEAEADADSAGARARLRPLGECEVSPCHADKSQKCGGVDRLLVYSFVCTPGDNTTGDRQATQPSRQVGRALPTSYGSANGTIWLPAEEDFTLQAKDSWFYNAALGVRLPSELRKMYETSSGGNTGLIISIGPFANGSVPLDQLAAAKALGTYVRRCYNSARNTVASSPPISVSNKTLSIVPAVPSAVEIGTASASDVLLPL